MSAPPTRILVVEDSPSDYEMLGVSLAGAGLAAELGRVEDEPGMRAALAAGPWEVVLSDYNLPRFSLQRALTVLREHDPDVPLIVVSGAVGEETAVQSLLAGAEDFVMKGSLARLPAAIRRSLASAETRRRQRRAEEALRESEAMLRSLADNLPAAMLRLSYEPGRGVLSVKYAGGAAPAILGSRLQTLREEPGELVRALAPEERPGFLAEVRTAAAARRNLSWQGRSAEGRFLQIEGRLRAEAGGYPLWDAVAFDISDAKRAEAEVRELTAHLEGVKERERAEAAREIHDDIGALFFGLKIDVAWLRKRAAKSPEIRARLDSIERQLDSGVQASQRIVRALRPAVLDYGLVGAAEWLTRDFAKRTGIACEFSCTAEELELPENVGTAVFRVLQESLTNISRHSGARSVKVALGTEGGLELEVRDDGRGIAADDLGKASSFGLRGMRERARELGGELDIALAEGGGTRLRLRLPLPAPAARRKESA